MALLPLAGWAEDHNVTVFAKNKTLSFGEANPSTAAAKATMFDVMGTTDNTVIEAIAGVITFSTERTAASAVSAVGYDFTLSKSANYAQSGEDRYFITISEATAKFIVEKANLSTATIEITGSTALSGGEAKPAITVKVGSETLTKDTDYEVTYTNNTVKGNNANITVTAKTSSEKVTGSNNTTQFVVTADMSTAQATYSGDAITYDGTAKTIAANDVTVTLGGEAFSSDNWEIDANGYTNNINQGTATATIKGKAAAGYDGSITVSFTIGKRPITLNAKNGKRKYGEPNTKIVEATQDAGLVDISNGALAENQSVSPVISTSVAQNAAVSANAGSISLDQSRTKIKTNADVDVTDNYDITWGNTAATLAIEAQSLQSEDIEFTFTTTKQYDGTDAIPTYTFHDKNLNVDLTEGTNEDNKDFTKTVTGESTKNVGNYTIQFTGHGNYTGNKYDEAQQVTITAKPITITAEPKSIGTGETPAYSAVDYSANVCTGDNLGQITYKVYASNDNTYTNELNPAQQQPGTYKIHPSGLTNTNYNYTYEDATLTITATQVFAKVKVDDVTFGTVLGNKSLQHVSGLAEANVQAFENAVNINSLQYTIKDQSGNVAQTVKNYSNTDLGFYPAGTYTIEATGEATYPGYEVVVLPGTFTVGKMALNNANVTVDALARNYTGTAAVPETTNKITFKYGNNETDTLRLHQTVDYTTAVVAKNGLNDRDNKNAGSASAMIKISAASSGNYSGNVDKAFTINRAPLTITASDTIWGYGTAEPVYQVTVQGLVGDDAALDLTAAKQTGFSGILKVRNTAGTTQGVKAGALQPYFDNNGTIVEATGETGSTNYNITRNNADLTVDKTDIYLKVKDVQKVYGTAFVADGFVLDETKTTAVLLDDYKNNINSFLSNVNIAVAQAEKYNVGTNYAVTGTASSTNFEIKEIANGTFTLTPYPITVKTENQNVNLQNGETFNSVPVTGADATVSITAGTLQNGDLITALISSLTATKNVGENTISIVSANNANYTLTPTNTGILTITGANTITLGADAENDAATITQYAASENQVNVKLDMNHRVMKYVNASTGDDGTVFAWKAQTWFALVLPFKISVADLSKAFGYAVVNRLYSVTETEVATGGKKAETNFRLEMDSIPANEPFLLKTAKKVTEINAPAAAGIIDFGAQNIVAGTPSITKDGYTFYGTYTEKTVTSAQTKWSYLINGEWRKVGETSTNKYVISPFNAYFDRGEANAPEMVFNVQEIDGTTTSIKLQSADEVRINNVDGWYNLNGVKMQGAPTEKGIYIQNGKKVVIK